MKKRLLLIISFIIVILVGIAGAGFYKFNFTNDDIYIQTSSGVVKYDDLKRVYTSFYPINFLTKSLLGNNAEVINIVPTGGEAHSFEPTLKQIGELQKSDLIVLSGLGMESYEEKLIESVGTGKVIILSEKLNNLIKLDENELNDEHEEDNHGHEHGDIDPHTWLSPKVYKELANILVFELENAGFKDLDKSILLKLEELEKKYTLGLKNCEVKEFVTSHEAFGYLARDFGLIQHPVFGISPEEEPSAKDIASVVDLIKKEKLSYVFSEEFVSPKFADTIKKETGTKVLNLHPLESLTPDEELAKQDYVSIMVTNLEKLKTGLKCK